MERAGTEVTIRLHQCAAEIRGRVVWGLSPLQSLNGRLIQPAQMGIHFDAATLPHEYTELVDAARLISGSWRLPVV
jgi:hypothetical protein